MRPDASAPASPSFGQFIFDLLAQVRMLGHHRERRADDTLCAYCDGHTDDDGYCHDCQEFGA